VKVALAFLNCGIDELKALLAHSRRTLPSLEAASWRRSPSLRPRLTRSQTGSNIRLSSPTPLMRTALGHLDLRGLARPTELWSRISRQAAEIVKSNSAKSPALTVPPLQSPSSKSYRMAAGPRSLSTTRQGRVLAMPCRRTHEMSSVTAVSGRDLFIVGQMSVSRQQRLVLAIQILLPYCDIMPAKSAVKAKNRARQHSPKGERSRVPLPMRHMVC
jgi:hypothetical protein